MWECLRASPSLASLLLLVFVRRPLAGLPSSFRHDDDGFRRTTAWALVHHHKQRDKQVRYVVGALGAHRMSGHAPSTLLSGRYMDGRWPAAGEEEGDASAVVREGRSFFHAMQSGWRARAGRSGDAGCFDVLCGWGERDGSGAQVPRPACAWRICLMFSPEESRFLPCRHCEACEHGGSSVRACALRHRRLGVIVEVIGNL